MAEEDVELIRRTYAAYAEGDMATAGSAYSEDTRWDVSRFRPDEKAFEGVDDLAESLGSWRETWTEHSFSLEEIHDAGERVVTVIRESGRGRSSGAPVEVRYGQLVTVREGKITETVVYRDPGDAFAAAGLSR